MTDLLTSEDLLARLRISPKTLGNLVAQGLLPAPMRIGHRRYWRRDVLDAFLDAKAVAASSSERLDPQEARHGR